MKENVLNKNIPQLATIQLVAMGCHIQVSLNTTRLNMQY